MYTITIIATAFSHKNLTDYLTTLKELNTISYITLKKKENIITLLKSPHGHKKARNQYVYSYSKGIIKYTTNNFFQILFLFKFLQQNNTKNIKLQININK